jgi:hypothetical protein
LSLLSLSPSPPPHQCHWESEPRLLSGAFLSWILGLRPLLRLDLHFAFFLHLHSPYHGPLFTTTTTTTTTTVPLSLTPCFLLDCSWLSFASHQAADLLQPCIQRSFPDLDSVFYFSVTRSNPSTNTSIPSRSRSDNYTFASSTSTTSLLRSIRTSWTSSPCLLSTIYLDNTPCTVLLF